MIAHFLAHPLGFVHLLAAIVALVSGLLVLLRPKGTARHRWLGRGYFVAMITMNGTALLIYELFGRFGPFHWLAVISLVSVLGGFVAARRRAPGWRHRHAYFMVGSYVGVVAGAVAEVASRVPGWSFGPSVVGSSALVIGIGLLLMWRLLPKSL